MSDKERVKEVKELKGSVSTIIYDDRTFVSLDDYNEAIEKLNLAIEHCEKLIEKNQEMFTRFLHLLETFFKMSGLLDKAQDRERARLTECEQEIEDRKTLAKSDGM